MSKRMVGYQLRMVCFKIYQQIKAKSCLLTRNSALHYQNEWANKLDLWIILVAPLSFVGREEGYKGK